MIEQANKQRRPSQFAVGDLVWVKSKEFAPEESISQKLLPAYRGPWQILDVIGDVDGTSYVIEIPPHLRTYPVFHASKLLPCVTNELFPSRRSAIPPSMDGKYDVDKIVAESTYHTGRRGRPQRQYKVLTTLDVEADHSDSIRIRKLEHFAVRHDILQSLEGCLTLFDPRSRGVKACEMGVFSSKRADQDVGNPGTEKHVTFEGVMVKPGPNNSARHGWRLQGSRSAKHFLDVKSTGMAFPSVSSPPSTGAMSPPCFHLRCPPFSLWTLPDAVVSSPFARITSQIANMKSFTWKPFSISLYDMFKEHHPESTTLANFSINVFWGQLLTESLAEQLGLVGQCFEGGIGIQSNKEAAAKLYILALEWSSSSEEEEKSNQGVCHALSFLTRGQTTEALCNLARCCDLGKGRRRDPEQALKFYEIAASKGDHVAMYHLGRFCEYGRGGKERSDKEARMWYERASESGNPAAFFKLGLYYLDPRFATANDDMNPKEAALKYFEKGAEAGHPEAQFLLASMGAEGMCMSPAQDWLEKAASQGCLLAILSLKLPALTTLPKQYLKSYGPWKWGHYSEKGLENLIKEGRHFEAGYAYMNGFGEVQDEAKGLICFSKAWEGLLQCVNASEPSAKGGSAWSTVHWMEEILSSDLLACQEGCLQYNIALCFALGRGVPQTKSMERYWLKLGETFSQPVPNWETLLGKAVIHQEQGSDAKSSKWFDRAGFGFFGNPNRSQEDRGVIACDVKLLERQSMRKDCGTTERIAGTGTASLSREEGLGLHRSADDDASEYGSAGEDLEHEDGSQLQMAMSVLKDLAKELLTKNEFLSQLSRVSDERVDERVRSLRLDGEQWRVLEKLTQNLLQKEREDKVRDGLRQALYLGQYYKGIQRELMEYFISAKAADGGFVPPLAKYTMATELLAGAAEFVPIVGNPLATFIQMLGATIGTQAVMKIIKRISKWADTPDEFGRIADWAAHVLTLHFKDEIEEAGRSDAEKLSKHERAHLRNISADVQDAGGDSPEQPVKFLSQKVVKMVKDHVRRIMTATQKGEVVREDRWEEEEQRRRLVRAMVVAITQQEPPPSQLQPFLTGIRERLESSIGEATELKHRKVRSWSHFDPDLSDSEEHTNTALRRKLETADEEKKKLQQTLSEAMEENAKLLEEIRRLEGRCDLLHRECADKQESLKHCLEDIEALKRELSFLTQRHFDYVQGELSFLTKRYVAYIRNDPIRPRRVPSEELAARGATLTGSRYPDRTAKGVKCRNARMRPSGSSRIRSHSASPGHRLAGVYSDDDEEVQPREQPRKHTKNYSGLSGMFLGRKRKISRGADDAYVA
ncbi:hypothetical protein CBR_g52039 [Chara braunii]|uniref:Tf2-1-like SH3-like domain-containing protein n=1 Tax=Chara braunii TaxID=69332 RepID=A0A388M9A8_CHABU|nr:hypothetical protein CBR_g52039 [Chara braunii]|eukprot:GBG91158.1 hypothetical protein CBR_g52039 [Chara braunii]